MTINQSTKGNVTLIIDNKLKHKDNRSKHRLFIDFINDYHQWRIGDLTFYRSNKMSSVISVKDVLR